MMSKPTPLYYSPSGSFYEPGVNLFELVDKIKTKKPLTALEKEAKTVIIDELIKSRKGKKEG